MQLLASAGEGAAAGRSRGRNADYRLIQSRKLLIVNVNDVNGAARLRTAAVLPFDESVAIKGYGGDGQVCVYIGGEDIGDAAAGLASDDILGFQGDHAGFDKLGGVGVVARHDVNRAARVGALIVQPFDKTVVWVRNGLDIDLGADVMVLTRLVVLPIDLELAGAVAGRVDVQGQGHLGDK